MTIASWPSAVSGDRSIRNSFTNVNHPLSRRCPLPEGPHLQDILRRQRDSNPQATCVTSGFQDRPTTNYHMSPFEAPSGFEPLIAFRRCVYGTACFPFMITELSASCIDSRKCTFLGNVDTDLSASSCSSAEVPYVVLWERVDSNQPKASQPADLQSAAIATMRLSRKSAM